MKRVGALDTRTSQRQWLGICLLHSGRLPEKLRVELSKPETGKSNDNALVECKNGHVVESYSVMRISLASASNP